MDKTIPLTLDIYQPVNPENTFEIWRGDSVVFNFTFTGNGADIPLTDADKLRVFAKKARRDQYVDKEETPLFAGDFTNPITRASFGSTLTAGDAGPYLMTVMLMKGDTVITAQGVYFNLLENGYAGIYQPSEDFRDEVIDAKDQAQAAAKAAGESATAAGNSSSAAASSASSASTSAQQAAQDKNAVAEMKTSVEGTKTQIDNAAEQVATDRAAAEIAAGTAVNASDLAALSRRAANVGFFEFDGGKVTGSMAFPNFPFSICTTVCAKTMPSGFQVLFQSSVPAGISVSLFLTPEKLIMDIRDGGNGTRYQHIPTDFTRKLHTIVWVARSLTDAANVDWTLYIDGLPVEISAISTLFSSDDVSGVRPYGVNSSNDANTGGAASTNVIASTRLRLFNFDMSAESAPYSVADYAAGIDPSPALMQGVITTTDPTMGASAGDGWNIESAPSANVVNGDWTAGTKCAYCKNAALSETDIAKIGTSYAIDLNTGTADSHPQQMLFWNASKFAKFQGKSVRARISFWIRNNSTYTGSGSSLGVSVLLGIGWNYTQIYRINVGTSALPTGVWKRIDEEITVGPLDYADNYLGVGAASGAGTFEGAPYTIADFKFEVLGAQLSLADAADAPQIRDESGNGNHALISGAVLASKNNNPARCSQAISWAGTSTLQNVCGDAAIPANCKVTAFAKATGAVTASFKAGANAAQSKDLAANTLTEIGSWLCGAAGAFSVQPSAAYTGSIETYLIIERL